MRVVVTGATGTLGSALVDARADAADEVIGVSRSKPEGRGRSEWRRLDVRDKGGVDRLFGLVRPGLVVHSAAVVGDWGTTATGSVNVAQAAVRHGTRQVHLSTDAVFASREEAYRETDLPCPVTPYGAAKAAAETVLCAVDPMAAIVRTSLIVGNDGRTPRERVVHEAVADPFRAAFFTDEIRSPVSLVDLVAAVWEIAVSDRSGVHHVAGPDALSQYDLAVLIARRDRLDPDRIRPELREDRPGAAVIRLDCTATQEALRVRLRGAREFLSRSRPVPQVPGS